MLSCLRKHKGKLLLLGAAVAGEAVYIPVNQ